MKKFFLLGLLPVVFLAGCFEKEEETIQLSDTKFDMEICNKYFELADCIFENDPDESISAEERVELKEKFVAQQEELKEMDPEELEALCSDNYNTLIANQEALESMGCRDL